MKLLRSKAFRLAATLLLLFLVYRREDPQELFYLLTHPDPRLLGLIFVLYLFNTVISAWKWRIFLVADGIHISLPKLTGSYLAGTFLNLFLPSSIGGDAYRIYDVARMTGRPTHSFASVLAERLSGFVALVTLGLAAGAIGFSRLPDRSVLWIAFIALIGLSAMIILLFQQNLMRWLLARPPFDRMAVLHRITGKLFDSINAYRGTPHLFTKVMALSFAFQSSAIVIISLFARSLGIDISLLYFAIFVPLISLVEALPISIFGLGIRDAGYAIFFGSVGVGLTEAKSMALLYVVFTVLFSLLGGLVLLVRALRGERPRDLVPPTSGETRHAP